ncbi:hypothetical protein LHJ74_09115 [Streptomyces sp. N2-109]|uniref:Integral membrane protein n=1 Tax=Streptomyces gossypii TaxID=2883101 RepID=A0ABT2JQA9_9ACTN|nr:hypothetical protein [Streptomyces gossypii]MCT2590069.1 hypothetical protein [Streptomyces gossypii]
MAKRDESAEAYVRAFRERAQRWTGAGIGVLILAGLLWLWFMGWLLLDYHADDGGVPCEAPISREPESSFDACLEERDWPALVLLGGVASCLSVVGAASLVYGRLSLLINEHRATMALLPPP